MYTWRQTLTTRVVIFDGVFLLGTDSDLNAFLWYCALRTRRRKRRMFGWKEAIPLSQRKGGKNTINV